MSGKTSRHRDIWLTAASAAVAAAVLVSAATGFMVLPALQDGADGISLWARICGAAGISSSHQAAGRPAAAAFSTSAVVMAGLAPGKIDARSIGRGATLATRCTSCHGARGVSQAASPNLAGQYAASVYKQLRDYASGARTNTVMSPRVVNLTDSDMRDLAAYYAFLPRLPNADMPAPTPVIVASGAPMRSIAPCAACHGPGEHTMAAPSLTGEPYVYLSTQLGAFASGTRHNDISQQMRNVARGMSGQEIEAAARFYAQGS